MGRLAGYLRTLRQYARSPKTRFEYRHYAIFLFFYLVVVLLIWGGIYFIHGNY